MHIFIKNKKLIIHHYKVKCSIGKRGIGIKKKEGDQITPKGRFKIAQILYRKDRISNFKSKINKININKSMGWCDDPRSKQYNKLINFPFKYSAEKLYRKDNIYDIILVLNFNLKPIVKKRGSAIFLHISRNHYLPTKGCIAISKRDMHFLISKIDANTKLTIY